MWFMGSDVYSIGREWQLWQQFRACLMDEFQGERMFRNVLFFYDAVNFYLAKNNSKVMERSKRVKMIIVESYISEMKRITYKQ